MKYGPGGADPQAGGASRLRRVGSFRPAWGGLLTLGEDGSEDVAISHPSRLAPADPGVPQCGGTALQGLCGPKGAQVLPKGHCLTAPAL